MREIAVGDTVKSTRWGITGNKVIDIRECDNSECEIKSLALDFGSHVGYFHMDSFELVNTK